MSVVREAIVLPMVLLTVALLGGLRTGAQVRLLPPPVIALTLGMLLLGCLVRAGAFAPERLMNGRRTTVENLSGLVVVLALLGASAQVFNLVTPDSGLLHLIFSVFFLVQLLTTLAGVPERAGLLRALTVLLGSAFLLRFVVLESLYRPGTGVMKRVLTAVMEGVTLGTLQYEPNGPATSYVAFFTVTLFLIALVLLPARDDGEGLRPLARRLGPEPGSDLDTAARPSDVVRNSGLALILVALGCVTACGGGDDSRRGPGTVGEAKAMSAGEASRARAVEVRERALQIARVWQEPVVPPSQVDFAENPGGPGAFRTTDDVACRFSLEAVGGTTQKFNCELPGGDVVKVKYGTGNAELPAEVAASRLMAALGFGADRMYVVHSVRCFGCPRFPFQALRCLAETGLERACFPGGLDYSRAVSFDPAVIERQMAGSRIEASKDQGWAWFELDRIDPAHGGSPRAEVDALRLIAVFLGHWDNKSENQRLVCLPGGERADGSCARPFAVPHDLGATFGPFKLDLRNWSTTPLWADARACRVSMKTLPFDGGTFPDVQISEEGRRLLLSQLEQLSDRQIRDLFTASGVTRYDGLTADGRDADAWLAAFRDKVRQLRGAGPCPPARALTSRAG